MKFIDLMYEIVGWTLMIGGGLYVVVVGIAFSLRAIDWTLALLGLTLI